MELREIIRHDWHRVHLREGSNIDADSDVPANPGGLSIMARDVVKTFGPAKVLSDLSFEIASGQFVAIVGPSGCGKSTLLRLFAGLERPTAGSVDFSDTARRRSRIACVFQEHALLPWRRATSNIALPLELQGLPREERRKRVAESLSLVGLTPPDGRKRPKELSGGMRMRVSLARALVTRPELLLLDEPFAALDDLLRQRLNDDVHRLWQEQGWTAVLVTHNVAEAVFLANRVLVMAPAPGRIVSDVRVPFDGRRDFELRSSVEFAQVVADVNRWLRIGETTRVSASPASTG
jgi:NitT/TauT family transport system ATP-binding protein